MAVGLLLPPSAAPGTDDAAMAVAARSAVVRGAEVAGTVTGRSAAVRGAEVAVTLTARSEKGRYTLNGITPGPQIRMLAGQTLRVTVVNESVPEDVTMHWHGMRADAVTLRRGERHVYQLGPAAEGTYWYHAHRELFGALVVGRPAVDVDRALVVRTYDGRRTINGMPGLSSLTGIAGSAPSPGSVSRVRLINADPEPLRAWVSGTPFRVVAVDGHSVNGPFDILNEAVLVPAGGRVDLAFFGAARVDVGGGAAVVWGAVQPTAPPRDIVDLLSYGTPAPLGFDPAAMGRRLEYQVGRRIGLFAGMPGLWWSVNRRLYPEVPAYLVRSGEPVHLTVTNASGAAHPFHLHGARAVVLSRDGVAASGSPWWFETLSVGDGETYEIALVPGHVPVWAGHTSVPAVICVSACGGRFLPRLGVMPLSGEYEPSTSGWARKQAEKFESSQGASAGTIQGYPIVLVTSVGAISGKLRKTPLMRVEHDGEYLAVGSLGGAPKNPVWVHNLRKNPHVELQDGAERHDYVARELSGEERAVWWERAVAAFPHYAGYQAKTSRLIPVFLLSRLPS